MFNINLQKIGLVLSLVFFWLLLSGHYTFFMFILGGIAVVLVSLISIRMGVVDPEGQPLHFNLLAFLVYWCWLLKEIVKANIDICARILQPSLPITPRFIEIRPRQGSDIGLTIFANSVTLTPGTVAVDINQQTATVHALSADAASALEQGEMNRRVAHLEAQ